MRTRAGTRVATQVLQGGCDDKPAAQYSAADPYSAQAGMAPTSAQASMGRKLVACTKAQAETKRRCEPTSSTRVGVSSCTVAPRRSGTVETSPATVSP